jgi:hypothetical protein
MRGLWMRFSACAERNWLTKTGLHGIVLICQITNSLRTPRSWRTILEGLRSSSVVIRTRLRFWPAPVFRFWKPVTLGLGITNPVLVGWASTTRPGLVIRFVFRLISRAVTGLCGWAPRVTRLLMYWNWTDFSAWTSLTAFKWLWIRTGWPRAVMYVMP